MRDIFDLICPFYNGRRSVWGQSTFNTQRLYIPHDERFQKVPSCSPRNSFPAPYQGSVMNLYDIDRFSFTVVCECLW